MNDSKAFDWLISKKSGCLHHSV